MRLRFIVKVGLFAPVALAAFAATPATASDSVAINLRAQVAPFCRISAPEDIALPSGGGSLDLGMIRETCNAANGYVVRARVHNVTAGTLFAGTQQGEASNGEYRFVQHQASRVSARALPSRRKRSGTPGEAAARSSFIRKPLSETSDSS